MWELTLDRTGLSLVSPFRVCRLTHVGHLVTLWLSHHRNITESSVLFCSINPPFLSAYEQAALKSPFLIGIVPLVSLLCIQILEPTFFERRPV